MPLGASSLIAHVNGVASWSLPLKVEQMCHEGHTNRCVKGVASGAPHNISGD